MKGVRTLETLCTVCKTVVGVKQHYRGQLPDDFRVARHAVPDSRRVTEHARRVPICTGSGIVVTESVVIPA